MMEGRNNDLCLGLTPDGSKCPKPRHSEKGDYCNRCWDKGWRKPCLGVNITNGNKCKLKAKIGNYCGVHKNQVILKCIWIVNKGKENESRCEYKQKFGQYCEKHHELINNNDKYSENIEEFENKVFISEDMQNMLKEKQEKTILSSYMLSDGYSKDISELRINDELMGEDSKPCKILDIQKVREKGYLVEPVKGDSFIIGESEILTLLYTESNRILWAEKDKEYVAHYFNKTSKKPTTKHFSLISYGTKEEAFIAAEKYFKDNNIDVKDENIFNLLVEEYQKMNSAKIAYKIYKKELEFNHKNFEIDPYIIGLWLGDGSHIATTIISADEEIVDYLRDYFEDFDLLVKTNNITHRVTSGNNERYPGKNIFLQILQEYNLIKNKHIPQEFLLTSRENRLRILAGLLDSDGYLNDNCYDFIQKREHLLDQTIFLARSLGFSCYKNPCIKICTNSTNGPKPGIYYRCIISGEGLEEIPTLLQRKRARERQQIKRVYVTGILLKDVGEKEIYRIITDKPTYLMSDFTVRHRYEEGENNDKRSIIIKDKKLTNSPFGYNVKKGEIVINEEESKIVRIIFEEFYNGNTLVNIANKLNQNNFKTRRDELFTSSTISGMINYKEKYLSLTEENGILLPKILEGEKYLSKNPNQKTRIIFGYTRDKNKNIIIEEDEAKIIRIIDRENKKNSSRKDITDLLNQTDVKPKLSEKWTKSNIAPLIRNIEKYRSGIDYPKIL